MEDDTPYFPITQTMHISAQIREALDAKFSLAFQAAARDGDVIAMMDVSDLAWKEYLRLMRITPAGAYDPVTGEVFDHGATHTAAEKLYRRYFGTYPFPRAVSVILDKVMADYGIETLSKALEFWQSRGYNHRNVAGIANYAKGLARDEGRVVTHVPDIFKEPTDDIQNG